MTTNDFIKTSAWFLFVNIVFATMASLFIRTCLSAGVLYLTGFVIWLGLSALILPVNLNAIVRRKRAKQVVVEEINSPPPVEDIGDVIDLTGIQTNPNLAQAATERTLKTNKGEQPIFDIKDIRINLEQEPSGIIYGSSGSGKSVLSFSVMRLLQKNYPNSKFVVADYGQIDWANADFRTLEDFVWLFEKLRVINKGRQYEISSGKPIDFRIIVLAEELESFFDDLKINDKANKTNEFERMTLMLGQIIKTSRKTGACHLFGVMQSPKADTLNTTIRNNMAIRFGGRSPMRLATMMDAPKEIAQMMPTIMPGIAYCNLVEGFVRFPKMAQPDLPILRKGQINSLSRYYLYKYPQIESVEENV